MPPTEPSFAARPLSLARLPLQVPVLSSSMPHRISSHRVTGHSPCQVRRLLLHNEEEERHALTARSSFPGRHHLTPRGPTRPKLLLLVSR